MTKAQIWVAVFVAAFIILFLLQTLTKPDKETIAPPMMEDYSSAAGEEAQTGELTGLDLMRQTGCLNCHGANLDGSTMGPALTGIKSHYTKDQLIAYLKDPASFAENERIKEFKTRFQGTRMPAYNNKPAAELNTIADYLLAR